MKQTLRSLLCVAVLAASVITPVRAADEDVTFAFPGDYNTNDNSNAYGMTNYAMRGVHHNAHRRMAGASTEKLHQFGAEEFYGVASLAVEYQQTRNNTNFAQWFSFASDGNNDMTYGHYDGLDSSTKDIDGFNFGVTASGTVNLDPRIQNINADIDLFLGFDEFVCGLWARIGVPINHTRWDLRLTDTLDAGTADTTFGSNLMDSAVTVTVPYSDLKTAWVGDKGWGDVPVMTKGRIDGRRTETAVAGLKLELGYDFIRREYAHLAASFMVVAPTGNEPTADYLFEAVSGARNSWEVGGNISGHYNFWENADCNSSFGLHVDATVTSLLKRNQTRLWCLIAGSSAAKSSPGASFLLLKKFTSAGAYSALERGPNVLALKGKVGASIMANVGAMFKYTRDAFGCDFGYEFYHRSKEQLNSRTAIAASTYGIKGMTPVSTDTSSTSTITLNATADTSATYIADADIREQTALHPAYNSHKLFSFYQYNWNNCDWEPTLGVGGSYEFGAGKDGAENIAADQWGVMIKGSISF